MSTELMYIEDAYCGWCYGFAPVVRRLAEETGAQLTVVSGGMITGERVGPLTAMADYIRKATPRLVEMTGAEVAPAFLDGVLGNPDMVANSEVPALATAAFAHLRGQGVHVLDFVYAAQRAHFVEGKDLADYATYGPIAESFGIHATAFEKGMRSEEVHAAVRDEFAMVRGSSIPGFPVLVARTSQSARSWELLAHGWSPFEEVLVRYKKVESIN